MALIKCPECGKEISDKATACPGCGCPITQKKEESTPTVELKVEKKNTGWKVFGFVVIGIVAVVAIVLFLMIQVRPYVEKEHEENLKQQQEQEESYENDELLKMFVSAASAFCDHAQDDDDDECESTIVELEEMNDQYISTTDEYSDDVKDKCSRIISECKQAMIQNKKDHIAKIKNCCTYIRVYINIDDATPKYKTLK